MEVVFCLCCTFDCFVSMLNYPRFSILSNCGGHLVCSHDCTACWTWSLFNTDLTLIELLWGKALVRIRHYLLWWICSSPGLVVNCNATWYRLHFDQISFNCILSNKIHLNTVVLVHIRLKLLFCNKEIVLFTSLYRHI